MLWGSCVYVCVGLLLWGCVVCVVCMLGCCCGDVLLEYVGMVSCCVWGCGSMLCV